jgi:SAM-dependent methyltransferase
MTASQQTQGWESIWADLDELPTFWRTPEPDVMAWVDALREAGGRRVLDLGCGVGRHTVALARLGFVVTATDVSPSGLATCAAHLAREGLGATLVRHEMETLPFPDRAFDGLIAFNVIHHTTTTGMRRILAGMRRVLHRPEPAEGRPGGQAYFTAVAREKSNIARYRADVETGKCQEIEPFTFIYLRDAFGDKYLPHHYCDERELRTLLTGFAVDDLRLVREEYTGDDGVAYVSVHYHVQARRL